MEDIYCQIYVAASWNQHFIWATERDGRRRSWHHGKPLPSVPLDFNNPTAPGYGDPGKHMPAGLIGFRKVEADADGYLYCEPLGIAKLELAELERNWIAAEPPTETLEELGFWNKKETGN